MPSTERAGTDIAQLLRRFENIVAFTPGEGKDRNAAAVGAYQMEVESAALVRAAEDILSLTRILKESWLFGKLQTVGTSDAEKRAEEAAAKVAEGLARLQAKDGAGTINSEGQAMELDGNGEGLENGKDP
ncbi:hypothetical protein OEA41_008257 [Lepraria neglecta]|uniref:Mediator of RNA polymerase II transcription subunit 22 n=1 Tax=Lepraria neglecta TaxID=209136 RepID=A0AAD9ZEM8_9LECA|nr:hypothetical protein OEA41_008257 [Lepraria neglecta]